MSSLLLLRVKQALTRARKEVLFRRTSPAGEAQLRAGGHLPAPERYVAGLERGNEALTKKLNIGGTPPEPGMFPTKLMGATTNEPQFSDWQHPAAWAEKLKPLTGSHTPNTDSGRRMLGAMTTRHEIDEARVGRAAIRKGGIKPYTQEGAAGQAAMQAVMSGTGMPPVGAPGGFSHIGTEVLRREANHAAMLGAGGYYSGMRSGMRERPLLSDAPRDPLGQVSAQRAAPLLDVLTAAQQKAQMQMEAMQAAQAAGQPPSLPPATRSLSSDIMRATRSDPGLRSMMLSEFRKDAPIMRTAGHAARPALEQMRADPMMKDFLQFMPPVSQLLTNQRQAIGNSFSQSMLSRLGAGGPLPLTEAQLMRELSARDPRRPYGVFQAPAQKG